MEWSGLVEGEKCSCLIKLFPKTEYDLLFPYLNHYAMNGCVQPDVVDYFSRVSYFD